MALCHCQIRCAVLKKRATAQKLQQMLELEWREQMVTDSARWRATALRLIWSIVGLWGIPSGADKWSPILRGTAQSVGMGRGRRPAMAAGLLVATWGGSGGRPRGRSGCLRVLLVRQTTCDSGGYLGQLRQFWRQLGAALAC